MIPKYRAWYKEWKEMGRVGGIRFDLDGSVSVVLFKGNYLDVSGPREKIILMQSTGLEDANGNEIFEADVLRNNAQEYIFLVRYDYDNCRWFGEGITINTRIDITRDVLKYYSKIGNRWESPELLKEENATK